MLIRTWISWLCIGVLLAGCAPQQITPEEEQQGTSSFPAVTSTPQLSEASKSYLLSLAYETAIGRSYQVELTDQTLEELHNPVMMTIWEDGEFRGSSRAREEQLVASIRRAAQKLASRLSFDHPEQVFVHLFVLGDEQPMDDQFQLGLDAVRLAVDQGDAMVWPTFPIERNYTSPAKLFARICQDLDQEPTCYQREQVELYYTPAIHFGQSRDRNEVITYYRGKQLETFAPLTTGLIATTQQPAQDWLIENVDQEGKFTYVYNPSNGTYSDNNNMIRQLMASRLLAELAGEDEQADRLHQKNLNYIFANWYQLADNKAYIYFDNKSKIGAMAMAVRTLVASPYFDEYALQARQFANTILAMQRGDNSFVPWYIEPDYEYNANYLMTFYSGETILALLELYEKTNEQRYLDAALAAQDYYLDRYIDQIDQYYYPAYVPWHTMALNKLYKITGDENYAQAAFTLNDKLIIEMQDRDRQPEDTLGRFYNEQFSQYGTPHSSSDGVYMEGIVHAYELAQLVGDTERQERYWHALELAVHNLRVLQYREHDTYFMHFPARVYGALRYSITDNRIRVDTPQHMLDGLRTLQTLF